MLGRCTIFGYILGALGSIAALVGLVMLLRAAYRQSLAWLLGCFFFPVLFLLLLALHFRDTIWPFAVCSLGLTASWIECSLACVEC